APYREANARLVEGNRYGHAVGNRDRARDQGRQSPYLRYGRQRFHPRRGQSYCRFRLFVIKNRFFTFGILTMPSLVCGVFGSLTTVTYNSFSPSLKATSVVP